MKLVRVRVEHFACIRRATVELGPGLNVLYGPNDLGKSTLARAIRAALLLPHTSSAAQELVEWDGASSPHVELTLQVPNGRIWRIEKTFGATGGSSILRESTDGHTFSPSKKAREVDDEIRTMLGWGIAAPATKNAPKGLPTSFLSQVLLGEQTDVAGVLRQTIANDSDESGRERLTQALAALAQDPLFKSILDEAQAEVDRAFTPTGKRKRGQATPFREVTDEVKRIKDELERLTKRVDESETARLELARCNEELLRRQEARMLARARHVALREAMDQLDAQRSVAGELRRAREVLAEQEAQLAALAERTRALDVAKERLEEARRAQVRAGAAKDELLAKERAAEDAVRRAKSDEAEQARQLRRGELEKGQLQLEAEQRSDETERGAVAKARSLHDDRTRALRRAAEVAATRARAEGDAEAAASAIRDADRQLALVDLAGRLEQRRRLVSSIAELERVRAEIEADRSTAREHRARAAELRASIPTDLPDASSLAAMKQLDREREVAEAKLGGGLAVAIERLESVRVRGTVDGVALELPVEGPIDFEATRGFSLEIGELAKIVVSAGEKGARADAARLRERWERELAPMLRRAGAPDLASLVKLFEDAEAVRRAASEADSRADGLEQRATAREEQLTKLPSQREELAAIDRELEALPVEAAAELLVELGDRSLDTHRADLKGRLASAQRSHERALHEVGEARAEAGVLAEKIRAADEGLVALAITGAADDWEALEVRLVERMTTRAAELERIVHELAGLAAEQGAEVEAAERALAAVREALTAANAELTACGASLDAARLEVGRIEGEVETRRAATAKLDLEAQRSAVRQIQADLDALPLPAELATDEALQAAERDVEAAERAYERANDDARKAEGALQTVGGQVALEEQTAAQDALRQAERKEREVELVYDAWKLLVDKLREAENTEGAHLGEALSKPVTERFAELTDHRYGKLEVAATLEAEGLRVAGVLRNLSALSVGTQEQLATLLRLTVAEHLETTLVLDDHLTQTDPSRSAWFREVLRQHASKTQIVVLTCRPLDYLRAEDLPQGEDSMTTRAAGIVRAIDLSRLIQRCA